VLGSEAGGGQKRAGMRNPWSAVEVRRQVEMLSAGVGDSREKVIVRGATSGKPCAMTRFDRIPTVSECFEAGVPVKHILSPITNLELHIFVWICCRDSEARGAALLHHTLDQNT
jgi:hypothetical protein